MPRDEGKLWGARFERGTDQALEEFSRSIGFDQRLYAADIRGSMAYAKALARVGIIAQKEAEVLVAGLQEVLADFQAGRFTPEPEDEDIHTAVERRLFRKVGEVAGKLHTGRSRNDQVATDVRLYMLEALPEIERLIHDLQAELVRRAEETMGAILPGYTHLQHAQPMALSHWLLSWFWQLERDKERLADQKKRLSVLPLGSGALAGSGLGIDREALARELGFEKASENSLDAVGDRDFILEFLAASAILAVHLSRLSEDLILWSTVEFGFVELDEAFSTGSSLMPQKKNPDSLELIRAKTGRVVGSLVTLLTVVKGLPSSYNRDLQEDKEPLFDTLEVLTGMLRVMTGVISTLSFHTERMEAALDDYMLTTDLAEYLVWKDVPFRESHAIVGRLVRRSLELGVALRALPLEEFQKANAHFAEDVHAVFDFRAAVNRKASFGGTAMAAVRVQLERARAVLGDEAALITSLEV